MQPRNLRNKLLEAGFTADYVFKEGLPSQEILDYASSQPDSLIIIASKGHGLAKRNLCQEVLIQRLDLHLGKHEAIANFVRHKDCGDERAKDNFIRNNASKIEQLLDDVKICDPAIGSGAFPMGLLQEIFHAKLTLDWTLLDKKGDVKRAIIQNSIYGVDKDKGAVDIARLRFWLSLIVDEEVEPGKKPKPLPNFDYKIMQGDSLLESFKGYSLKYHDIQEELQQTDLFNTQTQINIFRKTHTKVALTL